MRVAVAVPFLEPGRAPGGELATRILLRGLDAVAARDVTICAVGSQLNQEWIARLGLRFIDIRIEPGIAGAHGIRRGAVLLHHATFGGRVSRDLQRNFDIVHFPLLPTVPLRGARALVTVWDVNHHDRPQDYGRATRAFRNLAYDHPAVRAAGIIAPTEFSAERIRSILPRAGAVHLVPPGVVEPRLTPPPPPPVVGRFAYYPAAWWPHKNHACLFEAFARLGATSELQLVLTGGPRNAPQSARELAIHHGIADRVTHLGYVGEEVVAALYAGAEVVVFPSLYEGFGIPPLEAMVAGTPVVAGDVEPVSSVVGDAGLLVDPASPQALADALRRVTSNEGLRGRLIDRGHARARFFSAEAGAQRHLDLYREIGGSTCSRVLSAEA